MDLSILLSKISSATTLNELNSYQSAATESINEAIGGLEEQIGQLAQLANPSTFIVNFIKMIKSTAEQLTSQLDDLKNGLETVNVAIAKKEEELQA